MSSPNSSRRSDDLVERVSAVAWAPCSSRSDISRFLKEFHDAPHRSERARSFVERVVPPRSSVVRDSCSRGPPRIAPGSPLCRRMVDWKASVRAASFVGHLIECGLLSHDLVRRHLIKPLITHHGYDHYRAKSHLPNFSSSQETPYFRVSSNPEMSKSASRDWRHHLQGRHQPNFTGYWKPSDLTIRDCTSD
jgi:hypothetical protein